MLCTLPCCAHLGLFTRQILALKPKIFQLLTLHVGFRARDESRKLKCGDIVLENDTNNGNEVQFGSQKKIKDAPR